jgi:hypothetical protein
MGKPRNIPYIHEVKITTISEERYNQFLHIIKMAVTERVKKRLEELEKQKDSN